MKYVERYGSARVAGLPDAPGGGGGEGQQKKATFSGSVDHEAMAYHTVQLGAGAKKIKVRMAGAGDADLYTQFSSKPTKSDYDCRPYKSGSTESCDHSAASGDTLEIMVFGWDNSSSSYSITVTWYEQALPCCHGERLSREPSRPAPSPQTQPPRPSPPPGRPPHPALPG